MRTSLKDELKKRGPFASAAQEAALAILRTSDLLENRVARLLRAHGLTPSQYNVLRILRGEGKPLPCLEVASRMVQVAPAITRVVEQLLALKYITRTQSGEDRRVFEIGLTPAAARLLKTIDDPILELHAALMANVSPAGLKRLIALLAAVRAAIQR